MSSILALLRKELRLEWRERNPFFGALLYTASTIYVLYLMFNQRMTDKEWVTSLWVVLLFVATGGLQKTFSQEKNRQLYYYYTVRAEPVIISKLIYSFAYLLVLTGLALLLYLFLLPVPDLNWTLFMSNLVASVLGISSALTFISSISTQAGQQQNLLAILGFPVLLPVLFLSISNAKALALGGSWADVDQNLLILIAVDAIIVSLSLILFPYSWRP